MTGRFGNFIRRAWIPLALMAVVAGLTAWSGQLSARSSGAGPDVEAQTAASSEGRGNAQRSTGRAGGNIPRDARTWPWWRDDEVKAELGLTDEKSERIDEIYQNRANRMRPFAEAFLKEEAALNQMVRERVVPYEDLEIQASKMESLRADVLKSRWVMFYRLYIELEPEQYEKLLEIRERRFRSGRGGSGGSSPGNPGAGGSGSSPDR